MINGELFEAAAGTPHMHHVAPGAVLLKHWLCSQEATLNTELSAILLAAPLRQMLTPGGRPFSVRTSNCGEKGWISDQKGYRYSAHDPLNGQPWPPMPDHWQTLAQEAARTAGFAPTSFDACLINAYTPGTKMGLHQDRDERDLGHPIVSVSLGLPAIFLFGGANRTDPVIRLPLSSGDVLVWGGPARLFFHGVAPLKSGHHPRFDACRYNLTFRHT